MLGKVFVVSALLYTVAWGDLAFENSTYIAEVTENEASAFVVEVNAVYTGNTTSDNEILYSLDSSPEAGSFRINTTTGMIFTKNELDREQTEALVFTALATCCSSALTARTEIVVNVTDVNDNPPMFVDTPGEPSISIPQEFTAGIRRTLPTAVDKDAFPNNIIRYRATFPSVSTPSLKWSDYFTVDDKQPILSTTRACDSTCMSLYEIGQPYKIVTFALIASTLNTDNILANTRTVNVRILLMYNDTNIHTPEFSKDTYVISIDQTRPPDEEALLTVTATDDDPGNDGQFLYKLSESTPLRTRTIFSVRPDSGEIFLNTPMDAVENYTLVVTATDSGVIPKTGQTEVIILVKREAEIGPPNTVLVIILAGALGFVFILFVIVTVVLCVRLGKLKRELESTIVDKENIVRLLGMSSQIYIEDGSNRGERFDSILEDPHPDYLEVDDYPLSSRPITMQALDHRATPNNSPYLHAITPHISNTGGIRQSADLSNDDYLQPKKSVSE